jgi:hypothetical protein
MVKVPPPQKKVAIILPFRAGWNGSPDKLGEENVLEP